MNLKDNNNTNLTNLLSQLLADTYFLYLKTQNFHWNVAGPSFYALHKLFEEQYKALAEAIDEIAERIRAIGAKAPGSFQAFSKFASIEETAQQNFTQEQMLSALLKDHRSLSTQISNNIAVCQSLGDEITADLFIERASAHQKMAWMIESST